MSLLQKLCRLLSMSSLRFALPPTPFPCTTIAGGERGLSPSLAPPTLPSSTLVEEAEVEEYMLWTVGCVWPDIATSVDAEWLDVVVDDGIADMVTP